jgi:NAD(P)H-hydrate epimerase
MRSQGAFSIAIDIPSGLEATTGQVFDPCVQADLTVTLGFPKTGLLADSATDHVGRLAVVSLRGVLASEGNAASVATASSLRSYLPIRNFDTHKGNYGRIGIVAGSPGYLGAGRLCSSAAVHAGGGLVTLYALPETYERFSLLTIPEVMVQRVESYDQVLMERHDVLAIGPGLGRDHDQAICDLVEKAPIPCVVDADALNAVSQDMTLLNRCAGPRLLTPHPGEMERLDSQMGRSRRLWAEEFVNRYPATLLLKGARTIVVEKGSSVSFNATGNPGMGSGGMGDVLTGVTAALIGSGRSPRDAAILGAWLCGRAAEIAIFNGADSQESLTASSVIDDLGAAFSALRSGDY